MRDNDSWAGLPAGARVVVDSAPIIYLLEEHPTLLDRFIGLFEAEAAGELSIAISTITVAEVLSGPYAQDQHVLAQRYESALGAFDIVPVTAEIARSAAQLRARYRLKLPDAIQLATAVVTGAAALVSHDRDFSRVQGIAILDGR